MKIELEAETAKTLIICVLVFSSCIGAGLYEIGRGLRDGLKSIAEAMRKDKQR